MNTLPITGLLVKRLQPEAKLPTRGSAGAAGYDLSAVLPAGHYRTGISILPGTRVVVPTGIAVQIPVGHYGRIAPRSGLAVRNGIAVLAGVVDPDFQGEIKVVLLNTGCEPFRLWEGDRIAQLILERCSTPDVFEIDGFDEDTIRGENGWGSTGR